MPAAAYAARGGEADAFARLNELSAEGQAAFKRLPGDLQPSAFEALSGAAVAVVGSREDVLAASAAAADVAQQAAAILDVTTTIFRGCPRCGQGRARRGRRAGRAGLGQRQRIGCRRT